MEKLHSFKPLYDKNCKILILGSFPSVKSRQQGFYYGHPLNRFWKVLASILNEDIPLTIDEKRNMLLKNHVALWDSIESCDIKGSSDSSIKNIKINNIEKLLNEAKIKDIYCNGKLSYKTYMKYIYPITKIEAISLPSTSPANARFNLDKLIANWEIIKQKN